MLPTRFHVCRAAVEFARARSSGVLVSPRAENGSERGLGRIVLRHWAGAFSRHSA